MDREIQRKRVALEISADDRYDLLYVGKGTQMPSSSPDPFSCYEMQRRQNENLHVRPNVCLITGFIPILGNNLGTNIAEYHAKSRCMT
jgi:hypothetical protein